MRKEVNDEIDANQEEVIREQLAKIEEIRQNLQKIQQSQKTNSEMDFFEYGHNCAMFFFFGFIGWIFGMIEDKEIGGIIGVSVYLVSFIVCYFALAKLINLNLGWSRIKSTFLMILSGVAGIGISLHIEDSLLVFCIGYVSGVLFPAIWAYIFRNKPSWAITGIVTFLLAGLIATSV